MEDNKNSPAGLGCDASGCPKGCPPNIARDVYEMLDAGSPRLAYAVATGHPLVPYSINIVAPFTDVGQTEVPQAGNDTKIVQDTLIKIIKFQVQNQNPPSGLDSLTDEFYQLQSGIQARVKVVGGGGGGYNPFPDYTPIAEIAGELWKPWLLTYTNGIEMDFVATVSPMPNIVTVTFMFQGLTSYWKGLIEMSAMECFRELKQMGFITDCYSAPYCQ